MDLDERYHDLPDVVVYEAEIESRHQSVAAN
jgi:hypothetical protein